MRCFYYELAHLTKQLLFIGPSKVQDHRWLQLSRKWMNREVGVSKQLLFYVGTFAKAVDYELFASLSAVHILRDKGFHFSQSFCPKPRFLILSKCFRVDLSVLLCCMSWPLWMILSFISMIISAGKVRLILDSGVLANMDLQIAVTSASCCELFFIAADEGQVPARMRYFAWNMELVKDKRRYHWINSCLLFF